MDTKSRGNEERKSLGAEIVKVISEIFGIIEKEGKYWKHLKWNSSRFVKNSELLAEDGGGVRIFLRKAKCPHYINLVYSRYFPRLKNHHARIVNVFLLWLRVMIKTSMLRRRTLVLRMCGRDPSVVQLF